MIRRMLLALLACLTLAAPLHAATLTVMPTTFQTLLDGSGNPISGGKVCTYVAGTTTPIATFTDSTGGTPNQVVITADSAGRFVAWLVPGTSYKFVYQSAAGTVNTCDGVTYRTIDNVLGVPGSASSVDLTGTAGEAITGGQAVYLSDGSGGKIAGQWYKADNANAYSALTLFVGVAPASITSGQAGTIRIAGTVTGLSSLSIGSLYYVGSAGALTATAPSNRRLLGQADTASSLVLSGDPPAVPVDQRVCTGRLTLTTATPVTTADVTAATTLFWTPYQGNRCALYDGTSWGVRTFSEISIAIPATTSQLYDVWLFDNGGTVALELLAWTSDTARATALVLQDGVLEKTGALTRRYVGSVRTTTVSGQTEDSLAKRYVWNYGNRVPRLLRVLEATATWTYTLVAWHQANAAATNQLDVVVGVAEVPIEVEVRAMMTNGGGGGGDYATVGIGEDSTTTLKTGTLAGRIGTAITVAASLGASLKTYPAVGRHTYVWLEQSTAVGTTTWWGTNAIATIMQSGIHGVIQG